MSTTNLTPMHVVVQYTYGSLGGGRLHLCRAETTEDVALPAGTEVVPQGAAFRQSAVIIQEGEAGDRATLIRVRYSKIPG